MSETTSAASAPTAPTAQEDALAALRSAEQALAVAQAASPDYDDIVTKWEQDCIFGSPVSRSQDAFNHMHKSAIPELRRRLKGNL